MAFRSSSDWNGRLTDEVALSARDICYGPMKDLTLDLHKGEILGLLPPERYMTYCLGPCILMERVSPIRLARSISALGEIRPPLASLGRLGRQMLSFTLPALIRDVMYRLINKMRRDNRSVLFISHDIEELMAICDSIIVLRDGHYIGALNVGHFLLDRLLWVDDLGPVFQLHRAIVRLDDAED